MPKRGPETFFTAKQKSEHAEIVGWQCEAFVGKGERCSECGYLEADHVTPISKGGATEEENLELLCPDHHALKHKLDEEFNTAASIAARAKKIKEHPPEKKS